MTRSGLVMSSRLMTGGVLGGVGDSFEETDPARRLAEVQEFAESEKADWPNRVDGSPYVERTSDSASKLDEDTEQSRGLRMSCEGLSSDDPELDQ